jgi:hypothetical protein
MEQELNAWLAAHPDIEAIPGRDLFIVARYLIPMEATLVCGCLEASGIPAVLADAHLMQTDLLLAPALGGVRILVPASFVQQAQSTIEAFERGEFALGEDADVSSADARD